MAGRLSDAWLDELRSRLNIVDVVSDYVPLKQKGRRYWGLCPFHNEKSASFSVDGEQQMYYCFGCHKGGHVIHFVMELERMDFIDAVKMLAERAHFPMPDRDDSPHAEASRELKAQIYEANKSAARYYHDVLWTADGAKALAYLHKRGLDDGEIRRFGLGSTSASWEGLTEHLIEQGFSPDVLVSAGLTVQKEERRYDMFRERVMFPIINAQDKVLGFGGRAIGDGNPKYLNTSDTPVFNKRQGLYAINFVRKERSLPYLTLVEGYMDVVALRCAGVAGVVATLGTALTEEQARLIKRYAKEVRIAYDGDSAGQKAALRALDIFDAQQVKARVIAFPDGQDPDDFIKSAGKDGFERLKPLEPVEYRMLRIADGLDLSDQNARTEYAIACAQLLKKVNNPVELELYVNRLSIQTGFSHEALMKQVGVSVPAAQPALRPQTALPKTPKETDIEKAQRKLIALLCSRLIAPEVVRGEDFDTPLYRDIAVGLIAMENPAMILDSLADEDRARAVWALNEEVQSSEKTALAEAEDCLEQIRLGRIDEEINQLQTRIRGATPQEKLDFMKKIAQLTKAKLGQL